MADCDGGGRWDTCTSGGTVVREHRPLFARQRLMGCQLEIWLGRFARDS